MKHEWQDRLIRIQKELANNHLDIFKLTKLRDETKKAFDDRIDQLLGIRGVVAKIRVPKAGNGFWKNRIFSVNWRYIISTPFIYGMIFPAIIWHIGLEIYHQICFRLYGIPLVKFKEYFIYDRQLLSWLNWWEKINCIYCSYVNNLIRYSSEIGGRTERYWCPIKYYRKIKNPHSQYPKFVARDNASNFRKQWSELKDFTDLK